MENKKNPEIKKSPPTELSVAQTSDILRVTERTVLNLIKSKKIIAVKVGKIWFVDLASVQKLSAKSTGILTERFSEKEISVSETENKFPEMEPRFRSEARFSETQGRDASPSKPQAAGKGARPGVNGLNCYRLAVELFSKPSAAAAHSEIPGFDGFISRKFYTEHIAKLQLQILESLGAGYHSFGPTKVEHYGKARAAAGGLLALFSFHEGAAALLQSERAGVEEKLLPALIALQRTAEKRGRV